MKIVSWNVNGIRAVHRKGELGKMIEKYDPDIICLQEIKSEQHQAEVDLPQYEEYWNPAQKKGYSGTAIFSKEKPTQIIFGFDEEISKKYKLHEDSYGDPNKEGRVISAEYTNFFLVNSYTPNSKGDLSRLPLRHKQWDPAFLEFMKRHEKSKPVIFCGDLNVAHTEDDLANPKENEGEHGFTKEEREGIDMIIKSGFIDTFRHFTKGKGHYTWWTPWRNARERNIGWRIDYFFASKKLMPKIKSSKILSDTFGSDHCPILIEVGP